MDIRINLLPPEIQAQWERKRRQQRLLSAGAVILLLFLAVYGALFLATLHVSNNVVRLQEERQSLENKTAAYSSYAELQTRKERVENLVRQAMGIPPDYYQILEGIGLYIPPNVQLTDFTVATSGEVTLRGNALDHSSAANWLEGMQQVPGLMDIRCQFAAEQEVNGQPLTGFEIKATLLPGQAPQPAVNKAGE